MEKKVKRVLVQLNSGEVICVCPECNIQIPALDNYCSCCGRKIIKS